MRQVKGNQGGRTREITKAFADTFTAYHKLMRADEECNIAHGRFSYASSGGVKVIYHDGDLIAKWDSNRGTQYGSMHNLLAAYEAVSAPCIDESIEAIAPMLRDISTRINTLLIRARRIHPNAGLSFTGGSVLILRDISKAETTDNIIAKTPLAGAVRSVI